MTVRRQAVSGGISEFDSGKGGTMAGTGETCKRADGKYAFRMRAGNNEIVATDGGHGYNSRTDAKASLEKLMRGDYDGPIKDV
jgi:uncharacterized protein YegP (UPF0339 family)